ncbi:MAG: hypothetical protein AAB668_03215 [Patescibacteria group bacterium]
MAQKASVGQVAELVNMCANGTYDAEFVQALIERRVEKPREQIYRLHVSYAKLPGVLALEEKFSGEGSVSILFDGREWERHSSCISIDATPGERDFRVAEIPAEFRNHRIKDVWNELAAYFDKKGERFAIETETVEFADARPELQRNNRILALGSSALRGVDCRFVTVLRAGDHGRLLDGRRVTDVLYGHSRLLLVRM